VSAVFSSCRRYRYTLTRQWQDMLPGSGKYAMFIGLNPSTADEVDDDSTIRRCIGFAKAWGFSGLVMTNLFAFRATDPRVMKAEPEPIGPLNDQHLRHAAEAAGVVVAAWGTHGVHMGRDAAVVRMLPKLSALRVTSGGMPAHPLYLPKTLTPQPFPSWQATLARAALNPEDC
jgi:hypothetical protein